MQKKSIYSLKVRYTYAVKHVEVKKMFTDRNAIEKVPFGEVYLFEFTDVEKTTLSLSFCGKSHTDIGEVFDESDKRPDGLPLCEGCVTEWKNHPKSPWRQFVNGEKAK